VSQAIQGTASLIFKKALIGLASRFGNESVLLPMHDAVLLQLDTTTQSLEASQADAQSIMAATFRECCAGIEPKVVAGPFCAD